MFEILLGGLITLFGITETIDAKPQSPGTVSYYHEIPSLTLREEVVVDPQIEYRFRNVVRQAFDYSCGSAALTTLLNYYLGRDFVEREVLDGLVKVGDQARIAERRGFSLLDMKRYVGFLGYRSGGFVAELDDIEDLEQPVVVPIEYAGFKHFVVIKDVVDGRVFVADPALGNIRFTEQRFKEIWDRNILFVIYPREASETVDDLALSDDDLRYVDDQTLNYVAYRELPLFNAPLEHAVDRAVSDGRSLRFKRQ